MSTVVSLEAVRHARTITEAQRQVRELNERIEACRALRLRHDNDN